MAWNNVHDDAPTDDEGRPVHPEKGHPICGYEKTDAVDKNGRKRDEYAYCLLAAGWGTDRTTGHCSNHYGASPGAPEGWRNGNARHLLYSKQMREDDREVFEAVVKSGDGELLNIEDMADMLKNSVAWEFTRLQRAIEHIPEAELIEIFRCPACGEKHREAGGECGNRYMTQSGMQECTYVGDFERVKAFVEFHDKAVERKEGHVANLIRTYKQVAEGVDIHVDGSHDVTHKGDAEAPVEVSITHSAIDLPEDERVDVDAEDQ